MARQPAGEGGEAGTPRTREASEAAKADGDAAEAAADAIPATNSDGPPAAKAEATPAAKAEPAEVAKAERGRRTRLPDGRSVHAAADAWAWLEPRLAGVPEPLVREIRRCLESSTRPAGSSSEALAVAALEALDAVVDEAPDRSAATRLLAADACLVAAFEAAAEGDEDLRRLASALGPGGSLGRRLADALPAEPVDPGRPSASGDPADAGVFLEDGLARLADAARASVPRLRAGVERYAGWVRDTLASGGTLFFAGNGGSAATSEHVAAEYVARFRRDRRPLAAVALPGSAAALTASANDFGFREAYARSLRALARPGDLAVFHSTSGNSPNLVRAAAEAAEAGVRTVALLAGDGGRLREGVDLALVVPTRDPAVAQELHLAVEHAVVSWAEVALCDGEGAVPSGVQEADG